MSKYKFSEEVNDLIELEKSDRCDKFYLKSKILEIVTENDDSCTRLANKVLASDIENMVDKIASIFQRETANCDSIEGKTSIDILVEWLLHINQD